MRVCNQLLTVARYLVVARVVSEGGTAWASCRNARPATRGRKMEWSILDLLPV